LVHPSISLPCLIKRVAKVIPVLNGRDSNGNIVCLGPQRTKIHRYLLVLCVAKSEPIFRSLGKEIDDSVYFTLYQLSKVANLFKDISPWHLPITYDRTKVAIKIYNMISKNNDVGPYSGLVTIKKIDGDTYVTTTKKGDEVCTKLLQDFIAYEQLTNKDSKQGWLKNVVDKFTGTLDDRRH
jgi:hypothetical protein